MKKVFLALTLAFGGLTMSFTTDNAPDYYYIIDAEGNSILVNDGNDNQCDYYYLDEDGVPYATLTSEYGEDGWSTPE